MWLMLFAVLAAPRRRQGPKPTFRASQLNDADGDVGRTDLARTVEGWCSASRTASGADWSCLASRTANGAGSSYCGSSNSATRVEQKLGVQQRLWHR
eukprot:s203_g19.t1